MVMDGLKVFGTLALIFIGFIVLSGVVYFTDFEALLKGVLTWF